VNRKLFTIYRMVDFWPRFQGHSIFRRWISQ